LRSALLRWNPLTAKRQADVALSGIARLSLTDLTYERAMRIGSSQLRSLDALHLAAAIAVGAQFLVTYDHRLTDSAATLGLQVIAPGQLIE
jgi:uncharacterized protein